MVIFICYRNLKLLTNKIIINQINKYLRNGGIEFDRT